MDSEEKNNRRSVRIPGYDYARSGAYFVTVVTKNRACILGDIVNGAMHLTEIGRIANAEWLGTSATRIAFCDRRWL